MTYMAGYLKMVRLDYYTMKSQVIIYLTLAAIVMIFGFMGSSFMIMCITGSWFTALLSSNIFAIQEKNGLHRLYGSVSISLSNIIMGRYIFYIFSFAISFMIISIIYVFMILLENKALELLDILLGFSMSLLVYSLIIGIQVPMFFKMGYTKAKIWTMIPFVGILALLIIPSFTSVLSGVVETILSHQVFLVIGGFFISCAILFLSYRFSLFAYRRRE